LKKQNSILESEINVAWATVKQFQYSFHFKLKV
jgi:hypothetical protein